MIEQPAGSLEEAAGEVEEVCRCFCVRLGQIRYRFVKNALVVLHVALPKSA
jgi:hypothetical protein